MAELLKADRPEVLVARLKAQDADLRWVYIRKSMTSDGELRELLDCLLTYPNRVANVYLYGNLLTDESGVKLALFVASSSTVECVRLEQNQMGDATYLAMAAALRVNRSLVELDLHSNRPTAPASDIDDAFVRALRANHRRPSSSVWRLYSASADDYQRLRQQAFPSLWSRLFGSRASSAPVPRDRESVAATSNDNNNNKNNNNNNNDSDDDDDDGSDGELRASLEASQIECSQLQMQCSVLQQQLHDTRQSLIDANALIEQLQDQLSQVNGPVE